MIDSFVESIYDFGRSLPGDVVKRDSAGEFCVECWQKCAEIGLIGMAIPVEYGGSGRGGINAGVQAMQALGYAMGDLGFVFGLSAQMWTVMMPLLEFGTEEQKLRYLPRLCDGSLIACHALTEPGAGSDAFSLETIAEACDGGYRLSGRKNLITLAPIAGLALVFANTDPAKGAWGVSGFLVERDSPGYHAGDTQSKMGLRTVPIGEITLDGCFVAEANRIGGIEGGFGIAQRSLEFDRCCILAALVGAMQRQLEAAIAHARTRSQFGTPIGKFQSVSNRIADMKVRLETGRLLLREVASRLEQGKPVALEAAMLKLHLSESFLASSTDALRIHGGTGYLTESGVERDLRDAMGGVLYAGTSDIQRNIISRLLGL